MPRYQALDPGQYRFYVRVSGEHGSKLEGGCCNFEAPSKERSVTLTKVPVKSSSDLQGAAFPRQHVR